MFRAMKKAEDSLPLVERSPRALGVRVSGVGANPPFDVFPDSDGHVAPGSGLSVAMDDPRALPRHRKPRALGGEGRDPVFSLAVSVVREPLSVIEDRPPHALIEPASRCLLELFELALARTRPCWKVCDV